MTHTSYIRPAWTPVTITMMVLGFMIFWPLGLAMLAYILWGDRWGGFQRDVDRMTDKVSGTFSRGCRKSRASRSGNVAFDDWRDEELARLKEERRKLDEAIAEFESYQDEKQRVKDTEEFDEFMTERKRKPAPRSKKASESKAKE